MSGLEPIKEGLQTVTAKTGCFLALKMAKALNNFFPKVPAQFCVRPGLVYILRL